ncbi:MAG: FHA domain-containing protein [Ignisphaera sp.]
MKRRVTFIFALILAAPLALSLSQPLPKVKAGFSPEEVEVEASGFFTLRLVILEGGSLVRAGEFSFSYTSDSLELLNITSLNEWVIIKVQGANVYAFYTLKAQPNETTIAELKFRCKQELPSNVTLLYLKAADAQGSDLRVILEPSTAKITIRREQPTPSPKSEGVTSPASPQITVQKERLSLIWIAVLVLSTSAVAAAVAWYKWRRTVAAYSLVDRSGRVVFRTTSKDRVYGREDFAGFLPPDKLVYITRRNKGGQFRIIRGRDGWYIVDEYSMNPTLVNGIPIKGRGYVRLKSGDLISVQGFFELYFRGE